MADLHRYLKQSDRDVRAYWMAALLREANTRDVWLFTTPQEIREAWPLLIRYLGRSRALWAFLLDVENDLTVRPGHDDVRQEP